MGVKPHQSNRLQDMDLSQLLSEKGLLLEKCTQFTARGLKVPAAKPALLIKMIPNIFLRYDTDSGSEACQRRKSRRTLEETGRRDQERAGTRKGSLNTGVVMERSLRRRTWTASVLDRLRYLMWAGNADIAGQDV